MSFGPRIVKTVLSTAKTKTIESCTLRGLKYTVNRFMVPMKSLGFSAGPRPPIPPMKRPPPGLPPPGNAPAGGPRGCPLCVAHAISSTESCEATISR